MPTLTKPGNGTKTNPAVVTLEAQKRSDIKDATAAKARAAKSPLAWVVRSPVYGLPIAAELDKTSSRISVHKTLVPDLDNPGLFKELEPQFIFLHNGEGVITDKHVAEWVRGYYTGAGYKVIEVNKTTKSHRELQLLAELSQIISGTTPEDGEEEADDGANDDNEPLSL